MVPLQSVVSIYSIDAFKALRLRIFLIHSISIIPPCGKNGKEVFEKHAALNEIEQNRNKKEFSFLQGQKSLEIC